MAFNSMLPPYTIPYCTEGYEGFYHLQNITGNEEKAVLHYIIRDHDKIKFEDKKQTFQKLSDYVNHLYGEGTIELHIQDSYYNMKEKIEPYMFLIDNAKKAEAPTVPACHLWVCPAPIFQRAALIFIAGLNISAYSQWTI